MKRRDMLATMGSLAISGVAIDGLAADKKAGKAASSLAAMTASDKVLKKAWSDYYATLEEMHQLTEATPRFQQNPQHRAKAYHTLMEMQAMAYNFAVAPRLEHPRIFLNCGWQTDMYTLGQNGQDFLYGVLFLDGRQTYRLSGRMGDISLFLLQTFNGLFGEKGVKAVGNYDWANFNVGSDGRFEVILSATEQPGNWIKLDPIGYEFILIRRALPNWHGDRGELKIDRINELPENYYDADEFDEEAMAVRIRRATDFLRYLTKNFNISLYDQYHKNADNKKNVLTLMPGTTTSQVGSPSSNYAMAIFDLQDDEALVIEMEKPPAGVYWSFQLGDVWSRALPFSTRHSSINNLQASIDGDGGLRAVVSRKDPGVVNWLDTCGRAEGTVVMRNYRSPTAPVPTSRKVKLSELDALLPKDTRRVSLEERKVIVEYRRQGQLKMYGE